jgi:hypothetical protein
MADTLYNILPGITAFGPLFIVLGLSFDAALLGHVIALAGAVATGGSLAALAARQRTLEARLDHKGRRREPKGA